MALLKSEYYELPTRYNQTMIRLLVQSPNHMYAYWEVSDESVAEFSKTYGNYSDCTPALKITNISKGYSYFVQVDPFANNYYIEVSDSGCKYKVELCRISKDYCIPIYTSNEAMVPINHPTYNYDASGILFGNYLCISNQRRIKVFAQKEQYKHFLNQNHTDFESTSSGSSEIFLRKL